MTEVKLLLLSSNTWIGQRISDVLLCGEEPSWLKHMDFVLFELKFQSIPLAACSMFCRRDSAWAGLFARSTISSLYSALAISSVRYRFLLDFYNSLVGS